MAGLQAVLRLTPSGAAKLSRVLNSVRGAMVAATRLEAQGLKAVAAAYAPDPFTEARILSRGIAATGSHAGQVVGTPEGGRFVRPGGTMSLQEAILTDPVDVDNTGGMVLAGTASAARINRRTAFYWQTRNRGLQGPTEPFNHAYVQAVENGGVVWTVVPRTENRSQFLNPEDGVGTRSMTKTVEPRGMFRKARDIRGPAAKQNLAAAARAAAKKASVL